jgi:hypothetical protein
MKYRILLFGLAVTMLVSLSSHAAFQDPANTSEKPLYHASGNEGSVLGTITVSGEVPKARTIDMSADPVCAELNKEPKTDSLITNQDRLLNVFIYVKESEALKSYRFEVPDTEVVLERKNCRYSPHVLGLRVGQRLAIVSNDPTHHNTHPVPKVNQEWNQTQPPQAPPLIKTFARPEVLIPFKCNHHPWEKAYVGVLDHPFFAVSDNLGNYEIRGLPSGNYKLVFWHERLGEQEVELTVRPGESHRIDLTFDASKANASQWD